MNKIILAAVFLLPSFCKAGVVNPVKDHWAFGSVVRIEPYFEYKEDETFPSFEEREESVISLNLINNSRELREYQVSKNTRMEVHATVNCGEKVCALNLYIKVLKKRIFSGYIIVHDIGANHVLKPRANAEDRSWNGTSRLSGVLNPNKDEPKRFFGVYCSLVPENF